MKQNLAQTQSQNFSRLLKIKAARRRTDNINLCPWLALALRYTITNSVIAKLFSDVDNTYLSRDSWNLQNESKTEMIELLSGALV